jgi:hypothetical protein
MDSAYRLLPETGFEEVGRISNRKSACRKLSLRLASILDGFRPLGSNAVSGSERCHKNVILMVVNGDKIRTNGE